MVYGVGCWVLGVGLKVWGVGCTEQQLDHRGEPTVRCEEGSYLRLIDFVSLNARLESNKE